MPLHQLPFVGLFLTLACASYGQSGIQFLQNRGQWPPEVSFRADLPGGTAWLEHGSLLVDRYDAKALEHLVHAHTHVTPEQPSRSIQHHAVRLEFRGANERPTSEPLGVRPGAYNYIIGNDPSHWAGNVHAFSAVLQKELYFNIDLRFRSGSDGLKYDLILAPGADPKTIAFSYQGADKVVVEPDRIVVQTSLGDLIETIPLAYQEIAGSRIAVDCHYRKLDDGIGFDLGLYDPEHELVIDPTLSFSTYSGSVANNFGYTATFDRDGFLYSGSTAFGQGYPTTIGAYQVTHAGGDGLFDGTDIALTKYDTTGTFLVWSTYLGGSSDELPHSLVVNANDELFVYGTTSSPNFPTTVGAIDGSFNGGPAVDLTNGLGADFPNGVDMIVAHLSADGSSLLASTYLGGTNTDGLNTAAGLKFNYADEVRGEVLLDANDNVYIASCTSSPDMPTTAGCFQPTFSGGSHDGVVLKLDASLTTIFWSTFFGGSLADAIYNLELDRDGHVYIAGGTRSTNLPTTPGTLHPTFQGGDADGFVAELSADGTDLLAGSYFGTSLYDQCYFTDLDQEGNVYLFGQTRAPGTQLISNAPYNVPNAGQFISKLDPALSTILISTRFGQGDGNPDISPTAFLVDYCDKIYVSGWGSAIQGGLLSTTGLEVTPDGHQQTTDGNDFYLAVFDIDLSSLFYATYFGGNLSGEHVDGGTSRFDRRGRVYQSVCAGCGGHSDFPIHPDPGAWSPTNNSGFCNNAVFKFDLNFPIVVADFQTTVNCLPSPVDFTNTSYGAASYNWSFGDETFSTDASPSHNYPVPGIYTVTLVANNPATCNQNDTSMQQVVVLGVGSYALPDTSICNGASVQIGVLPIPDPDITYQWTPATWLSSSTAANPVATPPQSTTYTLVISNGLCSSSASQDISVTSVTIDAGLSRTICGPNATTQLTANGFGSIDEFQWSTSNMFPDTLNSPLTDSTATVQVVTGGWYFVRSLDGICAAMDSVRIDVSLADPSILPVEAICAGDTATLVLNGIDEGSTINWAPAEEIISGQGSVRVLISPTQTTTFSVSVVSPAGCSWTGTAAAVVSSLVGSSVVATAVPLVVLAGETVQLQAFPINGVNYSWTPAALLNDPTIAAPTATVQQTTVFTVSISDGICTKDASVLVEVHDLRCEGPDIFVPNTFTPNGDGNNDFLYVRGRAIRSLEFMVFDRWGEKVFETNDPAIGWDGIYKGKPVDPAVFVYHLTAYCIDGQRYFTKGNVTVVR